MTTPSSYIAIVDDDADVRQAVKRLLAASSMEATTYESGEGFLASLRALVPACVILDLKMPGVSGLEVLQRLADRALNVAVIVLTADDDPGVEDQCLGRGAIAFLRKPFDEATLLAVIARATAARLAQ